MNREEKRVKIAEACGWVLHVVEGERWWHKGNRGYFGDSVLPNYFEDLNAAKGAVKECLKDNKLMQNKFSSNLNKRINDNHRGEPRFMGATEFHVATAEAKDLIETLGLTLGLWKEGEE